MIFTIITAVLGSMSLIRNIGSLVHGFICRKKVNENLKEKDNGYFPDTAVIVPCRGIDLGFNENIAAILTQNYTGTRYIFVTESTEDPAYNTLLKIIDRHKKTNAKVVTASKAAGCSQKIRNLIRAVKEIDDDVEVIVFADSDIRPYPDWLKNLVQPLRNKRVGVSTGYRWYVPYSGKFWSLIRSVWNMTSANMLFLEDYKFAWGGSMAMRRETFRELNIVEKWKNALSDDMIVTNAVKEQGYAIKFIPRCMVISYDDSSFNKLFGWIVRQMTIISVYDPKFWRTTAFGQWLLDLIFYSALIIVVSFLIMGKDIPWGVWLMLNEVPMGTLINTVRFSAYKKALYPYRDIVKKYWWIYITLHPVSSLIMSIALIKSGMTREITWRGIRYGMHSAEEKTIEIFRQ